MDDESIDLVVEELKSLLIGRFPGKLFQLDAATLVIDFRLANHRTLLISINPSLPRLHLINRPLRELEKQSKPLGQFALNLKKHLSNTTLVAVEKARADRIVRFELSGKDELHQPLRFELIVQLTGRSANLFLLDSRGTIAQRMRATRVPGQQAGETYTPPTSGTEMPQDKVALLQAIKTSDLTSPSAAAENFYDSAHRRQEFERKASAARQQVRTELTRQKKLLKKLENDLTSHANAERHKRIGDLLLANISTARRSGDRVTLIDYFADGAPALEVEVDENVSLTDEASRRFAMYSRSKRAVGQIKSRIETVKKRVADLTSQQQELERIIAAQDEVALTRLSEPPAVAGGPRSRIPATHSDNRKVPGTRRYLSSEGCEILVGRRAKDNDHLTFKIARPNDLWLHSADYPGSHVIVRNPTRHELPYRTIVEAAQLAAQFSQANKNAKVDVHYTQRKFLSKPKGAAPGLVRMSQFKTITVEPREAVGQIK
jgi:predicted ribosome quality control (RQC) complex YloA/Tae2 family protein